MSMAGPRRAGGDEEDDHKEDQRDQRLQQTAADVIDGTPPGVCSVAPLSGVVLSG
jgi:hypothetical protein